MLNNKSKIIMYLVLLIALIIGFIIFPGRKLMHPTNTLDSGTPSVSHDPEASPNPDDATNNPLDALNGSKFGILYYNLVQFGVSESELERSSEEEEALLKLFLKCTNFSVTGIDTEKMKASVRFTYPALDSIIPYVLQQTSENVKLDVSNILSMASAEINNVLLQSPESVSTDREFDIIEDASGGYKFGATTIGSGFIDAVFTIPYMRYMNEAYVSSISDTTPKALYGVSSVNEIQSPASHPDTYVPNDNSILISECTIELSDDVGTHFTKPITLDMDNDGIDETIWINSGYGLIIFEGETPNAVHMPQEWRSICESSEGKELFEYMRPIHLTVIDSDIHDGCIEIIVCMKSVRTDIVNGSYYVFSYKTNEGLRSQKLLDFGQTHQSMGLAVKGNHLAIEVFVNIMGFRYMQLNAKLDPEALKFNYYSNGKLFFKHTVKTVSYTGIPIFAESKALLAVPLDCYTVDDTGAADKRVTLPIGTVLTPVRASRELDLGGLLLEQPVIIDNDSSYPTSEDYADRLRKGIIMFRDETGTEYMVDVEITAKPGIELTDTNVGNHFINEAFYPESIYIGGIEQNILFKNLDYTGYLGYMTFNNVIEVFLKD